MECPKCSGGSYLVDEELVKVLENSDPVKILIKSVFQCRACSDRFSRLFYDLLEARKKPETSYQPYQGQQTQYQESAQKREDKAAEGLKFF